MMTAVIFDMDGVLLDTEPIYRECWKRAARDLGYDIRDELYEKVVGRTNSDAEHVLEEMFGSEFSIEEFRNRWQPAWEEQIRNAPVPLKSGVGELLSWLESHKVPKAIATSTDRQKAILCLRDLRDRFEVMVTGDEIDRGKPAPDIFLAAAEKLSVPPRDCWVVEDSEAGVRAAHAAGMRPIIVPDLKEPSLEVADLAECVCRSLTEVREVLEKHLKHLIEGLTPI